MHFDRIKSVKSIAANNALVFSILWITAFILYLPAAKAGMVGDFPAWLEHVRNSSFLDYINWNICGVKVLYQFTQIVTYVLYKLFGVNAWAWHLTQLTMHVACSFLLYKIISRLLSDANDGKNFMISFTGALLFCISPYASEVVVYEPCFHFSLSLLMMLLILNWTQVYLRSHRRRYYYLSAILYFLSTYSLELFYLTPFFTLTLLLYYYRTKHIDKMLLKKSVAAFLLPQIIFLCAAICIFLKVYGSHPPHSLSVKTADIYLYLTNPPKYLFHILLLGRFFSNTNRQAAYHLFENAKFIVPFYSCFILISGILIARFNKLSPKTKVLVLVLSWNVLLFAFTAPLWFYDILRVLFDRYAYFPAAVTYVTLTIAVSYLPRYVSITLLSVFIILNIYGTRTNNNDWHESALITDKLLHNFPDAGDKTVILLNCPQCLKGCLMIRAIGESEYKQMHNLFLPQKINNKMYDAVSYNLEHPYDGAHVNVHNDTLVNVMLNQWGTWWWYNDHGGFSYENDDYKIDMVDAGHQYNLILKHPAKQYMLLYQVGDQWKVVDWDKKNIDQN